MLHNGQLPKIADPQVQEFLRIWTLTDPVFLTYSDKGYDPAQCHLSAKHMALNHGGRRVHGWALWKFDELVLGEHHSVWQDHDNNLIDVTPPSNGGAEILFVRDDTAKIEQDADGTILLFTQRTSDRNMPWLWFGEPTQYTNAAFAQEKPDVVAYCQQRNMRVADILTDDKLG
jgi:hypothetical protein